MTACKLFLHKFLTGARHNSGVITSRDNSLLVQNYVFKVTPKPETDILKDV